MTWVVPRRDDNGNSDDIIEIDFDDEEHDTPADSDDDIEIVLHDDRPTPAPDRSSPAVDRPGPAHRRAVPAPEPEDDEQAAEKYCAVCGFALPPLETDCPRCARFGAAAQAHTRTADHMPLAQAPTQYPPTEAARRPSRVGPIVAAIIIVAIAAAIPFVILNSPGYKAQAAYKAAVQAQLAGDMETAKAKYLEALDYDPDMGLAAFGLGTVYLGVSLGGDTSQRLLGLMQAATDGVTTDLDQADRWFDHSIVLANRMPSNRALQDPNISTPRKLVSYAHAMKAMTAFIRYYAAIQADDFDLAGHWIGVAGQQVQQSLAFDPTNPSALDLGGRIPR